MKRRIAIIIIVAVVLAATAVGVMWLSGVFKPSESTPGGEEDKGGGSPEISYEGLHLAGETSFTAYENEVFTVPMPKVKNSTGEEVPLDVVYTVTDSNYAAQAKNGNTVKLGAGMYTIRFSLKDGTKKCSPLVAVLDVSERSRRIICGFSDESEISRVTDQPKVNFGTNNGTKKFTADFGGRQGLLEYAVGDGVDGTMKGDRDGFYVPFDTPVTVSEVSQIRFIAYVCGSTETRVAFGLKCDGDYASDYFWVRTGKNVWQNFGMTIADVKETWKEYHDGEEPKKIEGIYIRLPSADKGAKIYLDCIYTVG